MAIINGKNWKAGGTISKYRCLMPDSASYKDQVIHTSAQNSECIAVSTCDATATNPAALTYETLEVGKKLSVTASAGISAGAYCACDAAGKVVTAGSGDRYYFMALEAASTDGDVILAVCVASAMLLP